MLARTSFSHTPNLLNWRKFIISSQHCVRNQSTFSLDLSASSSYFAFPSPHDPPAHPILAVLLISTTCNSKTMLNHFNSLWSRPSFTPKACLLGDSMTTINQISVSNRIVMASAFFSSSSPSAPALLVLTLLADCSKLQFLFPCSKHSKSRR